MLLLKDTLATFHILIAGLLRDSRQGCVYTSFLAQQRHLKGGAGGRQCVQLAVVGIQRPLDGESLAIFHPLRRHRDE